MIASRSAVNELRAFGIARATIAGAPLNDAELPKTHAFWRACNYLALGMIYLHGNPLLREPLKLEHLKNRMDVVEWRWQF
jgi:xylulose-5-phosphate/fructose-6-phosphate phosphoketolase